MIISETTLKKAIAEGLLTAELADRLRTLAARETRREDPEKLRFISGFGDILVVIGILLFTSAIGLLFGAIASWVGTLAFAATNWGVAEYFTRKQRVMLPSILSALLFGLGIYLTILTADWTRFEPINTWSRFPETPPALAIAAVLLIPYFVRFRTSIVPAMIISALCLSGYYFAAQYTEEAKDTYVLYILPTIGLTILIGAIRLDYLDQERRTSKAEAAFWLHMLAATLIIHPIMQWTDIQWNAAGGEEAIALALKYQTGIRSLMIPIIFLIAILIDRRAILISSIYYGLNSFGRLINGTLTKDNLTNISIVLLIFGGLIIIVSIGWYPIRRTLLRFLPTNVRQFLPRADMRI